MNDPSIYTGHARGSWLVGILNLDRRMDVSFSPKGKSVRVWIDDEGVSAAPAIRIEKRIDDHQRFHRGRTRRSRATTP